jgi:hypothetical protein
MKPKVSETYYVEADGDGEYQWSVMKRTSVPHTDFIAGTDQRELADKIAKALNEAEGL